MSDELNQPDQPVVEPEAPEEEKEELGEELEESENIWADEPEPEAEPEPEFDLDKALAEAREEFQSQGVRGKDPMQEKIEQLEAQIAALKQSKPVEGEPELPAEPTVQDLIRIAEQRAALRVEAMFKEREEASRKEQERKFQVKSEQDRLIDGQLTILRDKGVVKSKDDEKGVLQTCLDYGITDIFKAAGLWAKHQKYAELENRVKNQPKETAKKEMLRKISSTVPVKSPMKKLDIRTASLDDIANAAMRRK